MFSRSCNIIQLCERINQKERIKCFHSCLEFIEFQRNSNKFDKLKLDFVGKKKLQMKQSYRMLKLLYYYGKNCTTIQFGLILKRKATISTDFFGINY